MDAGFVLLKVRGAAWLNCSMIFTTVLLGSLSTWALPEKETPAPPLQFTQLLQAPPGARANWDALRGKVVVLEFWATWCGPCVASLPHFNQLAASLDPAKFQFISVDDEDPKVVQEFLTRRKMAGWVGIDTTGAVFKGFGVRLRPTAIILDQEGRIVAVTNLYTVKAVDLQAVADAKNVKFEPAQKPKPVSQHAKQSAYTLKAPALDDKPVYEVSLTRDTSDEGQWTSAGPGHLEMAGLRAEDILITAYNYIPKDRLILTRPLPDGLYRIHAIWSSAENNNPLRAPFFQAAITYGLNLRVQWEVVTKKAYVLKTTEASKKLLIPLPPLDWGGANYWDGKVTLISGSMDDLAKALEDGLETPVVNETGIEGKFDAELDLPAKVLDAAKAQLLKTLGLELIQEDRPILMLEVSPREDSKKTAEAKPQPAPKP